MTRVAIIVCCYILTTSCWAQQPGARWEELVSNDAGFRASLPCKTEKTTREYDYSVGKRYGYRFSCEKDGRRFQLSFGDHNPETGESVQKFYEQYMGTIETAFASNIKSKNDFSIDGHAARRYLMNTNGQYFVSAVTANSKGTLDVSIGPFSEPTLSADDEKLVTSVLDSIYFLSK